jgi:hypothetical protein
MRVPPISHSVHCPRCDAMRCDAMRCDAMRCDAMRCDAMRCDMMRCDATVAELPPLSPGSAKPAVPPNSKKISLNVSWEGVKPAKPTVHADLSVPKVSVWMCVLGRVVRRAQRHCILLLHATSACDFCGFACRSAPLACCATWWRRRTVTRPDRSAEVERRVCCDCGSHSCGLFRSASPTPCIWRACSRTSTAACCQT